MSEIDEVAAAYAKAVFARDEHALLSLYDTNVFVFDMWDEWAYIGRDAWGGAVKSWFASLGDDRCAVTFDPLSQTINGDWAVWCATVRYAGLGSDGVEQRSMQNRMSWTLKHAEGDWRIIHEHSSAPADFQTLKVRLARER